MIREGGSYYSRILVCMTWQLLSVLTLSDHGKGVPSATVKSSVPVACDSSNHTTLLSMCSTGNRMIFGFPAEYHSFPCSLA